MKKLMRMSDSELCIMNSIWDCGEESASTEVTSARLQAQSGQKSLKPTTLLTFLSRLCEKGFLKASKQGKANVYTPLITRDEYKTLETRAFIKELHGGSMSSFLAALSGGEKLNKGELEELREWLEKK